MPYKWRLRHDFKLLRCLVCDLPVTSVGLPLCPAHKQAAAIYFRPFVDRLGSNFHDVVVIHKRKKRFEKGEQ